MQEKNHNKFLSHLENSKPAVFLAAKWLADHGYIVQVNPTFKANSHAEWKDFVDSGDIYLLRRVEIKQISADFTSKNDWPFGDKFIVCAKHSFDNSKPKPYGYFIISASRTHAAIVVTDTFKDWYIEKRTDSRYQNVTQEFYLAPLNCVLFLKL